MKNGYVNYEHKTLVNDLWILQKSTVRHAGEDERSTEMIWMKWRVLPPKYLGVLGRAFGFILEWSCYAHRYVTQAEASKGSPWKLKIDTKTCDLEKAALYVYIYGKFVYSC